LLVDLGQRFAVLRAMRPCVTRPGHVKKENRSIFATRRGPSVCGKSWLSVDGHAPELVQKAWLTIGRHLTGLRGAQVVSTPRVGSSSLSGLLSQPLERYELTRSVRPSSDSSPTSTERE
jgi:hypothetical protein